MNMRMAYCHCECAYDFSNDFLVKTAFCKLSKKKASHLCEYANEHKDDFFEKMFCHAQCMWMVSPLCAFAYEPSIYNVMLSITM